jgi:hypothetical protein
MKTYDDFREARAAGRVPDEDYFRALYGLTVPIETGGPKLDPPHPDRSPAAASPVLEEGAWEAPVPLQPEVVLSPFPTGALPAWVRTWVEAEAESLQVPRELAAGLALGALSVVAGGRVAVIPKDDWWEPVNLFLVIAMEPGSRKSGAIRDATAPVTAHEQALLEAAKPTITELAAARRIAEQVQRRLEKAAAGAKDPEKRRELEDEAKTTAAAVEQNAVPVPPRLMAGDVTPEQLVTLLHEHGGRMAIISAEPGVFGIMAGRYANGAMPNLDVYLAGHAGDALRVDRRGRSSEFIERPALTIVVMAQPHVLRQAARVADLRGRGLLDRFGYLIPTPNVGYRKVVTEPVPAAVRQRYHTSIRALAARLERRETPLTLVLSDEAAEALTDWRMALEPRRRPEGDLGGVLQGWASKADGLTVRVAALLHLAEKVEGDLEAPIGATTMTAAVSIVEGLIPHARAAYNFMGADPQLDNARRVLGWLRAQRRASVSQRQVHAAHQSRLPRAEDVEGVLHVLEAHGWLRLIPAAVGLRGGRPSTRYAVHPALQNPAERTEALAPTGSVGSVGSVGPGGRND